MHVAICGELGAGCTEVGKIVSERLNRKCISSSEIVKSLVLDFRKLHPSESFKEFERHVHSGEVNLDKMIEGKLNEILENDFVVVEGRSGFMLLGKKDVFKVLLVAPEEIRASHIAKRRGISVNEAFEVLRESDNERRQMVERLFKRNWLDPHNYDLVVNTASKNFEEVADLIIRSMPKI
ncbi:MAG: cytidylate kinase-like family protein [Candidatus Bathyarchaeia archaeon]